MDAIRDVFIFVEEDCELRIEAAGQGEERDRTVVGNRTPDQEPSAPDTVSSVRVRSEKLDSLVDLIGELVTVHARLAQLASARHDVELDGVSEEVERLTWELRDQVLNIRMLPIGTTFSRFGRLVRDLGEELGKDVVLSTEGAETELDKTVIERLSDPLVHLIRNCIDHGIEPPAVRQAAGKPPKGRIHLAARHSGAYVSIEVSDDGSGIDPERVRQRAAEMSLIGAESELSEKEIHAFVFHSGLSTAASVSSVSGRGVGMDVVKRAIDGLRGGIDILSRPGAGTTFTLKLPLTLAIIDGLLVKIGGDFFIFPLSAVEECIELHREDAGRAHGRNLVNVRDEIVPYIRLREQFTVSGKPPAIEQVVLTEARGQRIGFVVDEVVGEHQTVIKALGRLYRDVRGLSGATVLGDGSVALILDLPQLIEIEETLACRGWE
jgi:two-component system chemotaxis sensor kinase CheA